jgi:acetolactate synthase I/II/III large subunit
MIDKLMAAETRAAEGIVRVLEEAGIDMVFGIAGGNMGRLYDALYDHQSSVRTVLVRHEQLASVMAEVYGRLTGKPGASPPTPSMRPTRAGRATMAAPTLVRRSPA